MAALMKCYGVALTKNSLICSSFERRWASVAYARRSALHTSSSSSAFGESGDVVESRSFVERNLREGGRGQRAWGRGGCRGV